MTQFSEGPTPPFNKGVGEGGFPTIDNNITQWRDLEHDHDSSLSLKPSSLELLVNQFNNATTENSNDPEKISSSKYHDIEKMHNIEIPHKINHYPYSI